MKGAAWVPAAVTAVSVACLDAERPVPARLCQTPGDPLVTVRGLQTSGFDSRTLARNTEVDASTARFFTPTDIPVYVGGGASICFYGGAVIGTLPPGTPYARMHDTYGLVAHGTAFQLEAFRVFDYGDGASMDAQEDVSWTVRDVYFKYIRDDCVENDFVNSGTIENSLFDGCYEGFSSRPYTTTQDGSLNLVLVRNSLFRLQDMDQGYRRPGHGGFFKWDATAPMISLFDNVYRVDSPNIENDVLVPPANKLKDCAGNVMIWLGSGPFPEPLPSCYRLLTGATGLAYWNNAVAAWLANHPGALVDIGPPIVSLFSPADSATLTGDVALTATAVDDRAVAAVQFALNGQAIGSAVTTEAPLTKFTLVWNSRDQPNGTYTLTAAARDATGQVTTSSAITVRIVN